MQFFAQVRGVDTVTIRLPALTHLDISSNGLEALDLPANLDVSTVPLAYLAVSGNKIAGTLPQQLASLTGLSNLKVDSNFFNGTIPNKLGLLQPLINVDLQDNQLEGSLPPYLCAMSKLRNLNAKGNKLSGTLPEEFGACTGFDVRTCGSGLVVFTFQLKVKGH